VLTLSDAAKLEKNKLSSEHAWLILIELTLADSTVIRVTDNASEVVWPAGVPPPWQAFPFELEPVNIGHGELTSLSLRISNVTRLMQSYLEQGQGGIGATVRLRVVHSAHLDLTAPEMDETYDIVASQADVQWVTLTLGAPNPLLMRFPRHRYLRDHCRWVYKSPECGYPVESEPATCKRNLADCRLHSNTLRFGGFPGIPGGALYKL
jgi:phage-related protein